ncbi:hypothetical protein CYMTET_49872 [Cymbomonas tetramitiformis]|uniref:Uncharacterized protein n=1 Tax=Cymbomonas tetramitiformis TaxID=36881 RepID=A0AAE0EUA1_9CHLO|nr:hypothetical protein CYMTET_49872 [Cymbomonas tetramitiformis]
MEQVPHGPASGNTRVEAALAAAREVKQAAANKTHIPTANSQKAKYDKPAWARAVDSHLTVKGSVAVSKKHQLAISGLFHSQGGTSNATAIQANELVKNFPKAAAAGLQLYTASQIKSAVGNRQPYFEFWNKEIERIAKEYADKKLKLDKLVISGRVDAAWKAQGLPAVLRSAAALDKGEEEYSETVSKHLKNLDVLCEHLQTQNRSLQSHKDVFEKDVRNMAGTHKSSAKELIAALERECKSVLENIGTSCEALRKQLKREADAKVKRSSGSGKSTTEKKRMLPSDTLKRISDGVSARSLKRSRKVDALPTAANRPTRTAANTASKIIENMDLTTDDKEVDDDNETEYVIEEEEEEHEEEEEEDDDVANEEEIIKSLAVEGKALAVRSDGDEVFLFITTDGIKEGAKRVPGGFLRELAPGASYGRNAKLKRNEVLFAGPMDLRTSDIFKCAFSNRQLQRLLAGEEQVVEKTTGGDNGLDEMAMDAEGAGLAVDGEGAGLAVDGEAAELAMDVDGEEVAGLAMDGEAAGLAMDAEVAGLAAVGEPWAGNGRWLLGLQWTVKLMGWQWTVKLLGWQWTLKLRKWVWSPWTSL